MKKVKKILVSILSGTPTKVQNEFTRKRKTIKKRRKKEIFFVCVLLGVSVLLSAAVEYEQLKAEGKIPITEQSTYTGTYPDITKNVVGQQRGLIIPLDGTFDIVPFVNGYDITGPPEYRNDDGYTDPIILPFSFCFYGDLFNEFYINNNGNISFNGGYSTYTASGFPINDFPMLAPFWGDVDTGDPGSGLVYYRIESNRVTIIWDGVGYYTEHIDLLNTFELIFTDGTDPLIGIGNNVAFSYGDMQWTTGDASQGSGGFGGVPATVGINRGDGVDFALIGRFDHAGFDYDGPGGNNDGVDYLDDMLFTFNVCTQTSNIPPVASGFPIGIQSVCIGDTYNLTIQFLSPETGQTTSTIVDAGGLSDFSYVSTDGNPSTVEIEILGTYDNAGIHIIQFTATDDGIPPESTIEYIEIEIIDCPVPVTLSAFTAVYDNSTPTLQWTTQSENNNLGWNVYRSLSENIEQANQINDVLIPGYGTTSEPTDYVFTDTYEVENNTSYWYWLESTSYSGETDLFGPVTLTILIEENQTPDLPTESILQGNYPNPFNPHTMISFSIQDGESGALTIYNTRGQLLETHHYEAGDHQFNWNAAQYGSGIYFYKLETENFIDIKKMIMVK